MLALDQDIAPQVVGNELKEPFSVIRPLSRTSRTRNFFSMISCTTSV
jgi:hypothetical protein